ncbi:MAG: hypothetical protein COT71_04250 [Candidatus Andersenbacteria bacterium CG10_big_fil_rev_8_21_14_0_10_54_11]|uniref:DAGKc domain-containing protein n=1 Tax=Candidatus Andersenbacteria bacterium CG10_big_fil_rev_8_21_14_0_10_54_11 TaxID=1974485 RepID=A0A2M6WYC1_9BACT|nr:MAG: hypothetical protein COT71_04250 [Candidatus Andersenbacteria bacterium CG10_big_fil_rev_8_21_14_0_10_54_11]
MKKPPPVVILNKHARRVRAVLRQLEQEGRRLGASRWHLVSGPELETCLRQERTRGGSIIIGGGDGTIRTAAQVLAGSAIPLGIIPLGTGNNLAHNLGLPLDWQEAIAVAINGRPHAITLGRVNGHIFCSSASLGLSVHTVLAIPRAAKRRFGYLAYLAAGTRQFLRSEAVQYRLTIGSKVYHFMTHQLLIANTTYQGRLLIARGTNTGDDHLEIIAFGLHRSRTEHLKDTVLLLINPRRAWKATLITTAARCTVHAYPPQAIDTDGEVLTATPATMCAEPRTLIIRLPRQTPRRRLQKEHGASAY